MARRGGEEARRRGGEEVRREGEVAARLMKPLEAVTDGIRDRFFAKAWSRECRNRRRSENGGGRAKL